MQPTNPPSFIILYSDSEGDSPSCHQLSATSCAFSFSYTPVAAHMQLGSRSRLPTLFIAFRQELQRQSCASCHLVQLTVPTTNTLRVLPPPRLCCRALCDRLLQACVPPQAADAAHPGTDSYHFTAPHVLPWAPVADLVEAVVQLGFCPGSLLAVADDAAASALTSGASGAAAGPAWAAGAAVAAVSGLGPAAVLQRRSPAAQSAPASNTSTNKSTSGRPDSAAVGAPAPAVGAPAPPLQPPGASGQGQGQPWPHSRVLALPAAARLARLAWTSASLSRSDTAILVAAAQAASAPGGGSLRILQLSRLIWALAVCGVHSWGPGKHSWEVATEGPSWQEGQHSWQQGQGAGTASLPSPSRGEAGRGGGGGGGGGGGSGSGNRKAGGRGGLGGLGHGSRPVSGPPSVEDEGAAEQVEDIVGLVMKTPW